MTEYSVEKFYNEYAIKQEDTIIAVLDSGTNARKVCDLLNEQEETIQNQKMEINLLLEEMKEIRDKLTIYLEIKGDME